MSKSAFEHAQPILGFDVHLRKHDNKFKVSKGMSSVSCPQLYPQCRFKSLLSRCRCVLPLQDFIQKIVEKDLQSTSVQ